MVASAVPTVVRICPLADFSCVWVGVRGSDITASRGMAVTEAPVSILKRTVWLLTEALMYQPASSLNTEVESSHKAPMDSLSST